jgi:hypothetical protein
MATKGTAAKTVSSAVTSQQDSNVEARLKALEAKAHTPCNAGGGDADRIAALEARVDV